MSSKIKLQDLPELHRLTGSELLNVATDYPKVANMAMPVSHLMGSESSYLAEFDYLPDHGNFFEWYAPAAGYYLITEVAPGFPGDDGPSLSRLLQLGKHGCIVVSRVHLNKGTGLRISLVSGYSDFVIASGNGRHRFPMTKFADGTSPFDAKSNRVIKGFYQYFTNGTFFANALPTESFLRSFISYYYPAATIERALPPIQEGYGFVTSNKMVIGPLALGGYGINGIPFSIGGVGMRYCTDYDITTDTILPAFKEASNGIRGGGGGGVDKSTDKYADPGKGGPAYVRIEFRNESLF